MTDETSPFLRLKAPRPTGNVIIVFGDIPEDEQLRILEKGSRSMGAGAQALALAADDVARIDTLDLPQPILMRGLGIGTIHVPGHAGIAAVAQTFRAEEGVNEARPEFFMYAMPPSVLASDDLFRTWGVARTGAENSPFTGRGIRVAVLDTGFDLDHPDFQGRTIVHQSFVPGEDVMDGQGHGTHCIGTAAGPRGGANLPRYGIATEAEIYVGKVLNNRGVGTETDILAGMEWAIEQGCQVISMSLGRPTQTGEKPSAAYERLGRMALDRGALIAAAAGNDSTREFGFVAPVGAPANSPSIMAVAAVDASDNVANFSSGGINTNGGEVNIAAPGVSVFSSVPRPRLYDTLNGTSMACPHVAGIAALWAESDPGLRGQSLWDALVRSAQPMSHPASDVGAGMVQAPGGDEAAPIA
ncbi:S8 family peptidase [Paracoccus fontiphilus]|uniref:S8 family serine peptidase n=1 Tax=Paracoccus fontiphilus TaxID=1815556 RepID=A0ABV7IE93_9RHOB|nr:S8 family serine peptidase [Paracoccus fontiphilus]